MLPKSPESTHKTFGVDRYTATVLFELSFEQ